jgi:hypothetical protein
LAGSLPQKMMLSRVSIIFVIHSPFPNDAALAGSQGS